MKSLDHESATEAAGGDERYAVTLAVSTVGEVAAALVDANGDGADNNLDRHTRDSDGLWTPGSSSGGAGDSSR